MSTLLVLIAIASALLHAGWNTMAKRVGGDSAVLWLAQLVAAGVMLPIAVWRAGERGMPISALSFLALSGIIQGVYFWLLGKAYEYGDISVVYPIARGGGVGIAATVAVLTMGEKLTGFGLIGLAAVCIGTALVGLSSTHAAHFRASIGWALGVAATLGGGAAIDKLAVQALDPAIYVCCMFMISAAVAAPSMVFRRREKLRKALQGHKAAMFVIGIGSLASYLIILFAYRLGPLTYLIAFRESSVLFGALLGLLLFKEHASARKLAGICVIVLGLVCLKLG